MSAAADCELVRSSLLGQPANTASTLAFVAAGLWLLRSERPRWVGWGLIATGAGSFAFHGPMPPWGEWAHDVSLSWLVVLVGGFRTRWDGWSHLPALFALGLLFALFPSISDPVSIVLVAGVGTVILLSRPSPSELLPLGLLGIAAVYGRLGATGWPLCDPTSIWQPHAVWHVGAALAVSWWVINAANRDHSPLHQA